MRPSITKLYSSSRECLWSGATSVFGGIGCSTTETPPPDSSVHSMKRTPTDIRSTYLPSSGPSFRGPWVWSKRLRCAVLVSMGTLLSNSLNTAVSRT